MDRRWLSWLACVLIFSVASVSLSCSQTTKEKQCLKLYLWDSPIAFQPNETRKEPCRPVYYGLGDGDGVLDKQCYELQTKLTTAVNDGQIETVKELLRTGANANAVAGDSIYPLQWAASKGYLDIALLLLNNGADVNWGHSISGTPLTAAVHAEHTEIVELLLSRGANPNVEPDGGTPLAVARKANNREIIALLEKVGAKESMRSH